MPQYVMAAEASRGDKLADEFVLLGHSDEKPLKFLRLWPIA